MPMGVPERLRVVRDVAGFYPTTHGELTIATDLKDRLDTVAGCAGYLNGILLHQLNANTEDPEAAVRSVTNQIVGYAGKARADKFFLTELDREMRESQTDHRAAMGSAELHSGLGQFVRYTIYGISPKKIAWTLYRLITPRTQFPPAASGCI